MKTGPESEPARLCPYCGLRMKWTPSRWFGRGAFACDRCGEFPDFRPRGAAEAADSHPPPTLPEVPPHAPVVDTRPRVLMIDDSREERDLYALMLERDMRVLTASRGSDGLTLASRDHPDAIVLDVMMPGMDGWEVCRQLKANPVTAAIPVIMLTASDEPALAVKATGNGATALLTKPCPIERLSSVISQAIHPPAP